MNQNVPWRKQKLPFPSSMFHLQRHFHEKDHLFQSLYKQIFFPRSRALRIIPKGLWTAVLYVRDPPEQNLLEVLLLSSLDSPKGTPAQATQALLYMWRHTTLFIKHMCLDILKTDGASFAEIIFRVKSDIISKSGPRNVKSDIVSKSGPRNVLYSKIINNSVQKSIIIIYNVNQRHFVYSRFTILSNLNFNFIPIWNFSS